MERFRKVSGTKKMKQIFGKDGDWVDVSLHYVDRSKYAPHQGKKEMARRVRQAGKT